MVAKRIALLLRAVLAIAVLVLGVGVWQPSPARAQAKSQSVASLIKKGQGFFDEQRYEDSVQTLSAALLRPGIAKAEKTEVYKLLAFNYIVLQHDEEADGAVRGLLVIDEDYELPESESPRFRDFFAEVRQHWIDDGKPGQVKAGTAVKASSAKIKHNSPAQVDRGADVRLDGEIDDAQGQVAKVTLYYRQGSSGKFATTAVKYAMRKFSVDIPAKAVEPPLVEYYLVAFDEKGLPVAARGDAEGPLRIAVPEGGSVISSPWLWVPVSVAVVTAVVVVAVMATRSTESAVTVNVFE